MAANTTRAFYAPAGTLEDGIVYNALSLVGVMVDLRFIARWTELERLIAYDYAMREHLRASDNPTRLRERPWFVKVASEMRYNPYRSTREGQPGESVPISSDISLSGPGQLSGHYARAASHPTLRATGAQSDVSMTFFEAPLRELGVTRIELANFSAPCAGFSEFNVGLRIVARAFRENSTDPLYLHPDGTVCTHEFRPPDRVMWGEWSPS